MDSTSLLAEPATSIFKIMAVAVSSSVLLNDYTYLETALVTCRPTDFNCQHVNFNQIIIAKYLMQLPCYFSLSSTVPFKTLHRMHNYCRLTTLIISAASFAPPSLIHKAPWLCYYEGQSWDVFKMRPPVASYCTSVWISKLTHPLTEMSSRSIPGSGRGLRRPVLGADNLATFMCRLSRNSRSLNLRSPKDLSRPLYVSWRWEWQEHWDGKNVTESINSYKMFLGKCYGRRSP